MGSSRAWTFAFALAVAAFLSSIVSYGVAGPLAPDRLRDPAGVIQGIQARAPLPAVAFSPDGTRLGVLGMDAVVTLWDVASGQPGPVLRSQGADITVFAFDPSGHSVAGMSDDDRIILWDLTTGIERLTLFPGPLGSNVRAVGFNPDGTALASLGDGSSIIVWDVATGNATRVLSGPNDAVNSLAFSPDGKVVAGGSRDSTVALWNLSTGEELVTLTSPSGRSVERVAFSTDGGTLAAVGQDGHIMLWNAATGRLEHTLAGHAAAITDTAFSPDGQNLVSVGTDTRVIIWDAATGRRRLTLGNEAGVTVNDVAFSPDGEVLATATDDTDIALWDVGTGSLRRTLTGHDDSVAGVTFSPDGRTLASVGKDGQVIVWAVATGRQRFERHVASPESATGAAAAAAPTCPCSGWDPSTVPGTTAHSDPNSVELGVKFRSDIDGFINGIRFYKGSTNTGTHTGALWAITGQQLATATFTNETPSGWQEVSFATPVAITANTVYVASYHAPNGNYALDQFYFATSGFDSGPLHFLQDGVSGGNGIFIYSTTTSFPTNSFNASNYWVDVVFATTLSDTTPPAVTSTSPANGATGVNPGISITATFNEPIDPATIANSTFELRNASNALVSATVTYSAATRTASLTPNSDLANSATYTATVKGGATDPRVKDLAGNAMVANFTWSFTTAAASTCPCSGWDPSTVPGTPANPDPNSAELGVKFTSDVGGFINGIRFYKGSTNTGTHTGTLWTITGQQLATATFTNETPSGWQEVIFGTPVAISANTVYVASYHAPNGNYALDRRYFATSGFDNSPLHFLKDGVSGGNGVFVYSAGTAFPINTFDASNYYVDVVFSTTFSDTTPPSVVARSPASGATNVNTGSSVTATFDEAINPATIDNLTFELRDSGNGLVSATVTYNAATKTATLNPTSTLADLAAYTAILRGGATDPRVKDVSGNALAANVSWSFTTAPVVESCVSAPNAIVAENCQPGNPSSEWEITGIGDVDIQGFATDISVNRGQAVSFKVNTPASGYRLDIYRMGYYGGLGARKVATVQPSVALPQSQPACLSDANTGLVDCGNWAVSASWGVPATATSGIYFAKAVRTDTGGASHIFFIVRDDAGTSNLLFQTSDTAWQAYNSYGGNSLYVGAPAGRAYKVSYNRPVNTRVSFNGNSWVFNAEYPMVRWLERNGYDISYSTGVDSDRRGNLIGNHKVFLSVGHDEYWSSVQRTNVEAARNAGVHLAFFSGNEVFWKTRWENSIDGSATPYRTLVCYKETHANAKIDPLPNVWTGTWRDPRFSPPADGGRPENALMGTIFTVNDGATTSIEVPEADGKMRLWRNTSIATLAPGAIATLPFGTLGFEWDEDLDNGFRPGGVIRMSSTTVGGVPLLQDFGSTYASGTATHHLTLYRHSSNRLVFGAGTVQWSWGLDDNHDHPTGPPDARMQQATVNLFADMGVQTATLQPGLVPATASTDTTRPSSTIASPTNGSTVSQGSPLTISGTATDAGGGVVGGVEVSVDNGATWHRANGRASWSYAWSPAVSGTVTIRSRAIDDSGNIETPGAGVNVTVSDASPTLVAAYAFGEGAGSSVADTSGNAHTGTISGATWTTAGRFGSALTFDGTNDWVTVADAASLDLTTGMTLEAWVNPSVLSGWRTAIMKESAGGLAYSLYANDNAPRPAAYVNTGAADQVAIGTGSLPLNAWTHLAATYDGATLRLYVNGTVVGSQPVSGTVIPTSAALRIGGNSVWGEYFAGLIDEVRVYSGPLTASEIQADMVTPVGSPGDTTPPTPPSALSATAASATQINLIWTASTDNVGVTGYRVERCQGAGCTSFAQVSAPTGTSFLDSGLAVATAYQYRVRAADAAGNLSGYSNVATATTQTASDTILPTAPTNLSATAVSATQINLSWTASSDNVGVSGYQVERCQGAGCTTFVQVATPTGTSYSDSGLTAGTTLYRVRATDAAGNLSGYSNVATATTQTDTTPPTAPSNLGATASASGVVVSWSANTDPDLAGYHVYRRAGGTGVFARLDASLLTSPTFDDTLAPSGTSDYTVTAADTSGNESAQAPPVSATMAKANRVLNPGFEIDANTDTRPDSWSTDSRFTRSFATARSGTYSGRHFATTNAGYTITQVLTSLSAGTTYTFAGWVNVPATSDAFTFTIRVRWRNLLNSVIRTDTVKTYTATTAGWDKALASLVTPAGTTNAQVQMVVSSLNATVYVDDFALR